MSNTRELIDAIISGSAVETEEAFNAAMAERISTRLDSMRMEVAAGMFRTEQAAEVVSESVDQIDEVSFSKPFVSRKPGMSSTVSSGEKGETINPNIKKQLASDPETMNAIHKQVAKSKSRNPFEEVEQVEEEQIEERNKENAMMRKSMDASRGARYKAAGNVVPDREPEHKTSQAHNKAIGRSLRQEEAEQVDEASYSAKAARAGKDIGKPGKNFEKIAKSAAERYGSEEAGKRVAGAILNKLRAKG